MNNTSANKILILAANPDGTARLRLDKEVREIDEGLRRGNKREQFELEQKWAVQRKDFYRAILDYSPYIVHFCGHGDGKEGLVLEDESGQIAHVNRSNLSGMFEVFSKHVHCVFLNACFTEEQAEAITKHINYVICMNQAIGDKAAIDFAVAFYDTLAAGKDVESAFKIAKAQIREENFTSVLKRKAKIVPLKLNFIPPNPYQGLSAFKEKDAAFFFGREKVVDDLVQATYKQPLVAVVANSGSGKSSVVFAGLVPQLRKKEDWLIEGFRPGQDPFHELANALVRQLEPKIDKIKQLLKTAELKDNIQQGKITLQQVASSIVRDNPGKRVLLIADQFEELYTLCQNKSDQECFIKTLLTDISQKNFTLVLTLRADFYKNVLSSPLFSNALQGTVYNLSSMSRKELQTAIEKPAQTMGVQLEANLAQRMLDDVGNEPGNLPLLEFALTRLWEKQQNRVLTHTAYYEIGGVKEAIANHADQIYKELNDIKKKQQAQRIFVQLVRPGQGSEDTRRIATRKEVGEWNWELVSYLAGYQARLVVTGRSKEEDTVEIVHEALIRNWGELQKWMNEARDFRVWQERLRSKRDEWEQRNKDVGALLRGAALLEAQENLKKSGEHISEGEQDFIAASAEERDREQKQRESARQKTVYSLVVGLVLALGFAGFSWGQWQNAQTQKENAQRSDGQAQDALKRAQDAQKNAENLREVAQKKTECYQKVKDDGWAKQKEVTFGRMTTELLNAMNNCES
jgi:hypothetical protein